LRRSGAAVLGDLPEPHQAESMIPNIFRSYSMNRLRQENSFRDHLPDVVQVPCSVTPVTAGDCPGSVIIAEWPTALPQDGTALTIPRHP
jgi:hypothetical protein